MIRHVQIRAEDLVFFTDDGKGAPGFSFWDTVTDRFMEFDGEQAFENIDEFLEYFNTSEYAKTEGMRECLLGLAVFSNVNPS